LLNFNSSDIFTDDTFTRIYQDYGIRFLPDEIELEGYYNLPCGGEDCIINHTICQKANSLNDCYLFVDFGVPYADSSLEYLFFALKNNCNGATLQQGFINYATIFLFIAGTLVIRSKQNRLEVSFDEDEQTAQDYSIAVLNPPDDACDPEEWKQFFEHHFNCKVTVCTVGLANDDLVQHLTTRREILHQLELMLPPGTPLNKRSLKAEAMKASKNATFNSRFSTGVPDLYVKLKVTNTQLKQELKETKALPTTNVFVTFETEKGQREVLQALTVGIIAAHNNDTTSLSDPKWLFRGSRVLEVVEPGEPSTIRWQELNATKTRTVMSLLATSLATFFLIVIGYVIISVVYPTEPFAASLITTVFTIVFPMVAKMLMDKEYHRSESARQKWLFIKIAFFNVLVTSVLISTATPFTGTLDNRENSMPGLIPAVHTLFFSQLGLTPFMQLLDIGGNVQRHLLMPRAKTQQEMNMSMRGSTVFLAERYANLMKYLFLMLWYCAVYPAGFFMGFFALSIVYFADRFSLMRTWARTPQLGTQISDVAREYFTPTAIVLMSVLSAYAWSGFPYDNLCADDESYSHPAYPGNWSVADYGEAITILGLELFKGPDLIADYVIEEGAQLYKYCYQDLRAYKDMRSFPALPKFQLEEWMTEDQGKLVTVYGWTSVGILAFVALMFLCRIGFGVLRAYSGSYTPRGEDMKVPFSKIESIDSYMPQVQSSLIPYPLLLCDIKDVGTKLFNWTDPERPHSYYDVTQDVKQLTREADAASRLFSRVKHWPPSK
jgi:uncharacterized membrane protein YqjE